MRWTDAVDGRPLRHARAWLDAATWRAASIGELEARRLEALDVWIAAGRAVVVRRREPGLDAARGIGVGVALPLADDRTRIGFTVDPRAILRMAPPLRLDEVVDAAPVERRGALDDLLDRATSIGTIFHVYGSFAWQTISGERCVLPTSDLDLLWTAATLDDIDRVLRLLTDWESVHALRADGELLLPNGDGIAWRELKRAPDRILVKHQDRVSLQSSADWRSAYRPAPLPDAT